MKMAGIEKILFPVELAPISERIAPWVKLQTEAFGAELHVLHVVPEDDLAILMSQLEAVARPGQSLGLADLTGLAENRLRAFCQRHLPGARRVVATGDPVEQILAHAQREGISLIIMGTHGRKGLDRIILGSVALRVVRRASMPVMVVNPYLMEESAGAGVPEVAWPGRLVQALLADRLEAERRYLDKLTG